MNTDLENDPLIRAARRLPRDIEPPRDLWPEISAALDRPGTGHAKKARAVPWYYAMAAAVGCMALGGLITMAIVDRGAPTVAPQLASQQLGAPRLTQASFGEYTVLGPEYERARAQLAIGLAERIDRLPPAEREKIERNLGEIQRAVREINVALRLEPNNTLLQELLLSTYQQELAMLANVNQMAGTLPARTDT